jgi:hypothetical protein
MIYAVEQQPFADRGQGSASIKSPSGNTPETYRTWRSLAPDGRLALVERRLRAANDLGDGYPAAL